MNVGVFKIQFKIATRSLYCRLTRTTEALLIYCFLKEHNIKEKVCNRIQKQEVSN